MKIIVPYETEARMIFGVIFIEQILEAQETNRIPSFSSARDFFWDSQLPPEIKRDFVRLAQNVEKFNGPLPPTPGFLSC